MLMGALSDLQAARVRALIEGAGQTVEYRSFPTMGHAMHQQDPKLFADDARRVGGEALLKQVSRLPAYSSSPGPPERHHVRVAARRYRCTASAVTQIQGVARKAGAAGLMPMAKPTAVRAANTTGMAAP